MANTVNGGSHSSSESLNGEFAKARSRMQLPLRENNIRNTNGDCLVVIYNSLHPLTGSWVKLDGSFRNGNGAQHSPVISEDGAMEDLLAEAVEEQSKQGSRCVGAGVTNWAVVQLSYIKF